ncbi:MAG: tetratricopeptide repeat protein [Deltaproteobacteria bacterium]|nr:tetratricopeptide repeat protein [Deltaproteobacteria bacterium]
MPPLPHTAYAHYLEAKLAGARDDWETAVAALADAAAVAPDQPMLAVELARAQHRAKRDDDARATLAVARGKWPKHEQVWLASGDMLAKTAPVEAVRAYRRAIELDERDERAYLGLAKLEDKAASLATLRRLVKRVPASVDGHFRLGQRLGLAGDYTAASRELRAVLEHDPDHIDARLDLARVLRRQGKLTEAIAQTRGAFDRSGQVPDIAEELFLLLCEADDAVAALDLLTLLDDERSDADGLATVARLHRGLGRFDASKALAARIATADAELGALVLAETEAAAGEHAAAAARALAIPKAEDRKRRDRFVEARRIAATALLALGRPREALDALAPALAAKPDSVELALQAAMAQVDLGDASGARARLDALRVEDRALRELARARLADHAGDKAAALTGAEAVVRARPDSALALNLAGYLLADTGARLADAERYLRKARELSPGDPAVLDSWGWLLLRRGDTRGAVAALDRATRFAPREPEILLHLAEAWLADGAPRTATATLDRVQALLPRLPGAAHPLQKRVDALRSRLAREP